MKKKLIVLASVVASSAPLLALAQATIPTITPGVCNVGTQGTLFGLLCRAGQLLNAGVPVLIALGVLYFVWGVVQYFISADEEAKKSGRDRIIFGIIGLAVIIGLWGLVNLLRNTFDLRQNVPFDLPTVPVVPSP